MMEDWFRTQIVEANANHFQEKSNSNSKEQERGDQEKEVVLCPAGQNIQKNSILDSNNRKSH